MATNVLSRNEAAVEQNNAVTGSNRLRYMGYVNHLIGGEINKSTGQLEESTTKQVEYDVLQKFPDDILAEVLKSSATEFPQVQAQGKEFKYCKTALVVEFVLSNIQGIKNTSNIEAGILNQLLMQYDAQTYTGALGNYGFTDNPNKVELAAQDMTTAAGITAAIGLALKEMKKIGIRKTDYNQIAVGISTEIADIWDQVDAGNANGMTIGNIVEAAYPDISFDEIPEVISDQMGLANGYLEVAYRPMIEIWHGARPAIYDTEERRYGLEKGTLFAFETAGIKIEEKGAYVVVPKKA